MNSHPVVDAYARHVSPEFVKLLGVFGYGRVLARAEDVWVWDKNRPSRIIPLAEVHTTQDVTIEELKPEHEVLTTLPPEFTPPPED